MSRKNVVRVSTLATFLATSWNSWPLVPIGALTRSKARRSGPSAILAVYFSRKRDKPIGSEELAASMAPLMSYCIEQFGAERCMFESNFPVDKVSFSHHVLFNAFKRFSKNYSASERAALFHDTAVRAYRISDG